MQAEMLTEAQIMEEIRGNNWEQAQINAEMEAQMYQMDMAAGGMPTVPSVVVRTARSSLSVSHLFNSLCYSYYHYNFGRNLWLNPFFKDLFLTDLQMFLLNL